MAKKLRKTLPKNLRELLKAALDSGDEAPVRAALEACLPDARDGHDTVLAFAGCSVTLARWAIARGTDINAGDNYGKTPLHEVASSRWSVMTVEDVLALGAQLDARTKSGETALHYAVDAQKLAAVQTLLAHGLDPNAVNSEGCTALEWALRRISNMKLAAMVPVAEAMLAAGARQSANTAAFTLRAAENFEFHRAGFNRELVEGVAAAVVALCKLFGVEPPSPRRMHDGVSPIIATAGTWEDQHAELWELLVPSSGACKTVQGEVIRISGRVRDELQRNGGVNWNRDYRSMLTALVKHLGSEVGLSAEQLAEAAAVASLLPHDLEAPERLEELAVRWVAQNPSPLPLPTPTYRR